jgi:hypothetical protein
MLVMDRTMGTFEKKFLFHMAPVWFRIKEFFYVGNRTLKIYVVRVKGVMEERQLYAILERFSVFV